jgi:TPP-dependent pyruvate/acetoin dehydrogenase alpha subunit
MQRLRKLNEYCFSKNIPNEALYAGVVSKLNPQDNICGTMMDYSYALLKGVSFKTIINNINENTNYNIMDLYAKEKKFFNGSGIIAVGISKALELAFMAKKNKYDRTTVCFLEESYINENIFQETFRSCNDWDVPLIFCTLSNSKTAINGRDIFEVVLQTEEALKNAENEKKPILLEFNLNLSNICPIDYLKNRLVKAGFITEINWKNIVSDIDAEIYETNRNELSENYFSENLFSPTM